MTEHSPNVAIIGAGPAGLMAAEILSDAGYAVSLYEAMLLNVSAPFHCSLMQPAADAMAEALAEVSIAQPVSELVANVSASAVTDPETIRKNLVAQVTGRVRWTESVQFMVAQGVEATGEAGNGKVLTVMQRRIDKSLNGFTLGTPEDLEAFAEAMKG